MTERAHLEAILRWLNDLVSLSAGNLPMSEIKPRLAGMAALLADNFPEPAFCRESLKEVALKCKFFPSYGELYDALAPWWAENQPIKAIPFDPDGLNEEDKAWVRNWERHAAGDWGKAIPMRPELALANELKRLRKLRERAFAFLIANNEPARIIAQRIGVMPPLRAAASTIRPDTRYGPPDA